MYYAGEFFQVLSGTAGKPIDIVLLGGTIRLYTHAGDETSITTENMIDGSGMPLLHETPGGIRIDKQSIFSLIPQHDKVRIKIYIPENSDVNILMRGGNMKISGRYNNLRARTDAGNIKVDMQQFTVNEQAQLSVFAGEIRLKNGDTTETHRRGTRHIRTKAGLGELQAKVSLGEVRFKAAVA